MVQRQAATIQKTQKADPRDRPVRFKHEVVDVPVVTERSQLI